MTKSLTGFVPLIIIALVFGIFLNQSLAGMYSNGTLTCALAPKGSTFYITITLDDGKTPVTNATIDATPVETCNGVNTTITILMHPVINASGIASIDASYSTFYSVTIHYDNHDYPLTIYLQNSQSTCASVRVPSGSSSLASC